MVAAELCAALDSAADDWAADDVGSTEEETAAELASAEVGSAAEEVDELGSTTGDVVVTAADEASAISEESFCSDDIEYVVVLYERKSQR